MGIFKLFFDPMPTKADVEADDDDQESIHARGREPQPTREPLE